VSVALETRKEMKLNPRHKRLTPRAHHDITALLL
jgi:hypothetical protein